MRWGGRPWPGKGWEEAQLGWGRGHSNWVIDSYPPYTHFRMRERQRYTERQRERQTETDRQRQKIDRDTERRAGRDRQT